MLEAIIERQEEILIGCVCSDDDDVESNLIYQTGLNEEKLEGCEVIWNNA